MGMSVCLATIDGLRAGHQGTQHQNSHPPTGLPVITLLHQAISHICLLTRLKTPIQQGTHIFTQLPPHPQLSSFLPPSFLTPLSLASATDEVPWNRPPQT
jgi:hypothetical protein